MLADRRDTPRVSTRDRLPSRVRVTISRATGRNAKPPLADKIQPCARSVTRHSRGSVTRPNFINPGQPGEIPLVRRYIRPLTHQFPDTLFIRKIKSIFEQ